MAIGTGSVSLVALSCFCTTAVVSLAATAAPPPLYVEVPGEMEFNGSMCARPLQAFNPALNALAVQEINRFQIKTYVPQTDEYIFYVPRGRTENEVARELLATGAFQYVEPNWTVYPVDCPNDANFASQWHHDSAHMDSCEGWEISTGSPDIIVSICDTGIETGHSDFQLHRYEAYNAVDQQWESSGGSILPVHPHGTQTTGCVAANGNNGIGVSGVGWNIGHRMIRTSNVSSGNSSIEILTHAMRTAAEQGDKVASLSYSGVQSSSVETAGAYMRSLGSLGIWAAGNSSANMGGNRDDSVIVVGATDSGDNLAWFSNYGSFVDLVAPGESVYTATTGDGYASVSGTSFACPLVAGLAGLIFSQNPQLTPDEVEEILRAGCDDLGSLGPDNTYGYGRINVYNSMILVPATEISIAFPDGHPDSVSPSGGSTLDITVEEIDATVVEGSERFYVGSNGIFESAPISEVSSGLYRGTFPQAECGSEVEYYVSFQTSLGSTFTSPPAAPDTVYSALAAEGMIVAVEDDLEVESGWSAGMPGDTAETGVWTRVDPIGTAAQPENAASGSICFVTGQGSPGGSLGENDIDGGFTTLVSPTFDGTTPEGAMVSYYRWYSNDTGAVPNADSMQVEISNNGGSSWTLLEDVSSNANAWVLAEFRIDAFLEPTADMRVRFIASDLGEGSLVEAGVDLFAVSGVDCGAVCPADLNGDNLVDGADLGLMLTQFGGSGSADLDGNGLVDGGDLGLLLVAFGGC